MMDRASRIFVAGHTGLLGSALTRALRRDGFANVITRSHEELDLTDGRAVQAFFNLERPEYVFVAAARVGGINASGRRPAEFMHPNLAIATTVVSAAHESRVKRMLTFACSCVYPTTASQPLAEASLLQGPLEPTCESYALAKIAGIKLCEAHNRQYGTTFLTVCPPTLYGIGDNFDPASSHVIAALLRRFAEAVDAGDARVHVWGSGRPQREFLIADDFADACLALMNADDAMFSMLVRRPGSLLNVGPGEEISIGHLARLIASVAGFRGEIVFDHSMPDGAARKLLDCAGMAPLHWTPRTSLEDGLRRTHEWYRSRTSLAASLAPARL